MVGFQCRCIIITVIGDLPVIAMDIGMDIEEGQGLVTEQVTGPGKEALHEMYTATALQVLGRPGM